MENQFGPSPTALLSAAARAVHCLHDDQPHLIDDIVSVQLCEQYAPQALEYHRLFPSEPILAAARFSACVRRRFAENVAKDGRFTQCILLGGGLDAAIPHASRTWVIDLPEVTDWRKGLFTEAGIDDHAELIPTQT